MSSTTPVQNRVSPFYESLREQLRAQYIDGRAPGERLPSERQIAKQFESSPMTVGRILQEFQAEGLLDRVQGKGSFIKEPPAAPSLKATVSNHHNSKGSFLGGNPDVEQNYGASHLSWGDVQSARATPLRHTVIVASLSRDAEFQAREYWSHRIVSMAERNLQRAKVRTTIINRNDYDANEIEAIFSRLKADEVDSVLFLEHGVRADWDRVEVPWRRQVLRIKHEMGEALTVVQINFSSEYPLPFDSVTFNGQQGSFEATSHLADLGHREICFLGRSLNSPWVRARIEGFWQALELKGLDFRPHSGDKPTSDGRVFYADESQDDTFGFNDWPATARDVVQQFFAHETARHRFTGVVALNDQIAAEFMLAARKQGFKVPEDFSVVGFDDRLYSKSDGLTTVQPPIEELGEVAAELLLKRDGTRQNSGKLDITLNPSLVVRSSTRALKSDLI